MRNRAHHSPEFLVEKLSLDDLRSLAIIGMGKNAGKTTVLNHILKAVKQTGFERALAVTSIGLDGEDEDLVTGGVKPRIFITEGTIMATACESLGKCDATMEILALSGIYTAAGEVAIGRARSNGYVELAGPSIASDLTACEKLCRDLDPDCLFIVDGALSRKSSAGGGLTEAVILVVGAANAVSLTELARETARQVAFLTLPAIRESESTLLKDLMEKQPDHRAIFLPQICGKEREEQEIRSLPLPSLLGEGSAIAEELRCDDKVVLLRGAITDRVIEPLLSNRTFVDMVLVVEDGTRLFLSDKNVAKLKQRRVELAVLHKLSLPLICVNPMRRDGTMANTDELLQAIEAVVDVPVLELGPALV